ncbi:MAG: hypothetical protein WCW87_03320 [Candidatus Paceibacterota bacterium]
MDIKKTKINFEDDRGVIRDIFSHTEIDAGTFITCAKDSIRGNHYHEKTMQYDYILSGSFTVYSQKEKGATIEEAKVETGDFITHPFPCRHAYKALEDSSMISFTFGPRQGEEYEKDTIRLEGEDKIAS